MKSLSFARLLGLSPWLVSADEPAAPAAAGGGHYADIGRLPAPEARQGVTANGEFLYVISSYALGKYRKDTGARVAARAGEDSRLGTRRDAPA